MGERFDCKERVMAEKEYIEREYVLKCMEDSYKNAGISAEAKAKMTRWLKKAHATDVRPVVRATWKRIDFKPRGHDYECSSCRWKNDMATHFCPNCGADMREES